jgi:SAM-dependent methyltransferase
MELLIGCGSEWSRRITFDPGKGRDEWDCLVTLDYNADHEPMVVWDLHVVPWPFDDNTFDEVHAYEVLEHLWSQGYAEGFFQDFTEIHRVLKPDGHLYATVPSKDSPWVWGDPSHTRYIGPESLVFLSQEEYKRQVGKTPMSDFRDIYTADFEPMWMNDDGATFAFVLRAVKGKDTVQHTD